MNIPYGEWMLFNIHVSYCETKSPTASEKATSKVPDWRLVKQTAGRVAFLHVSDRPKMTGHLRLF